LDGVATYPGTKEKYDMDHQLSIFNLQMKLAAELNRPVSVHAVQCFGKLMDIFDKMSVGVPKPISKRKLNQMKKDNEIADPSSSTAISPEGQEALRRWPPAIMLHSYSGSPEQIQKLLRYPPVVSSRFYFSFSKVVNGRSTLVSKTHERIRAVPDDRILIESDLHDAGVVNDACVSAAQLVAEAKGWSVGETILKTEENAARFLEMRLG
jgi:Tat protein secretion system quality control protein TatD with DNase activity